MPPHLLPSEMPAPARPPRAWGGGRFVREWIAESTDASEGRSL